MINVVSVGIFDLDQGGSPAAADTYLDFRSSDEDEANQELTRQPSHRGSLPN